MSANKSIVIALISLSVGAVTFLIHLPSAHAALYSASGVLGQTDFTSSVATTTNNGLNYPGGAALDPVNHRLFVDDNGNVRELVFQLDANNNITTTTAAYVLGEPNFVTSTGGTASTTTDGPFGGAAYDATNNRLFVTDDNNNRVLVYNVAPSTIMNGENASYVLGQSDFTSNSTTTPTQSGMHSPDGLAYDATNNRLFVGDSNNRVLVFNVAPSTIMNGENASYVLGQPDFTSNGSALTQNGFLNPGNGSSFPLAYDATTNRLFVGDGGDSTRVLVFNVAPSTIMNGENASYVLGQPDFTSHGFATAQNRFNCPDGLAFDTAADHLFVSDCGNNLVLVFNVAPSTIMNGENAVDVLGQSDFVSGNATTTQSGFNDPEGNGVYDPTNNKLFIPDSSNNRVLEFSLISITTGSLVNGTIGSSYSATINATSSQGTVSFAVESGSLPPGLSLNTSSGAISGTPTSAGTSSFTIEADDGFSTGNFFDRASYTVTIDAAPTSSGGGGSAYYSLSLAKSGSGTGTLTTSGLDFTGIPLSCGPTCSGSFLAGQALTLTAAPSPGSMLVSWSGDCRSATGTVCSLSMNSSKNVTASFSQVAGASSGSVAVGTSTPLFTTTPSSLAAPTSTPPSLAMPATSSIPMPPFLSNALVNDHGTIYLIEGTGKIGFTSMAVFLGLGYKLSNVIAGDTSGYQTSQANILSSTRMAHSLGSWLLYKTTVYYATAQGMVPVPSWAILLSNGGQAKYILPMNIADLKVLRSSPTLSIMTTDDFRVAR